MKRSFTAVPTDEELYVLSLLQDSKHCHFNFEMKFPCLNTKEMPQVVKILQQELPSIMSCECFNDAHMPFCEEVTHTEIGHLFEHILLEFLCKEKMHAGFNSVAYEGKTSWNWEKEDLGLFHIVVDVPASEGAYLERALIAAVELMNKILATCDLTF